MNHLASLSRRPVPLLRVLFLALFACCTALSFAAASAKKNFDLPAADATKSLRAFSEQSGEQILYPVEAVRGVTTNAVQGAFTPSEALERMLADTELRVVQDRETGALSVSRKTAEEKNAAGRRVDSAAAISGARVEDGAVKLDAYEVTGSRIRRDPTEAGSLPVVVYSRTDIERTGAISIGDFTSRITQNTNNLAGLTGNGAMGARVTVNLRGLGNNTTLVLVNGRRVPRSGQGFNDEDYNIAGIPLAAVERVEVLTDGASAIYGADAIGGVINIITRSRYEGGEIVLQYGNTFDTDVAERSATVSYGLSRGRVTAFVTATASDRNSLGFLDRPFTATSDFSAAGGTDNRKIRGLVSTLSGDPLPGLNESYASIPPGQDGRALTPDDFAPYEGQELRFDPAAYLDSIAETRLRSARANFSVEVGPAATFYYEGSFARERTKDWNTPPETFYAEVPAANPFNPFGVDVAVVGTFAEFGRSLTVFETESVSSVFGLRGTFGSWRYDVGGSVARQESRDWASVATSLGAAFFDRLAESDAARAFNPFGDGFTTQPNSAAVLAAVLPVDEYSATTENTAQDAKLDGTLWELATGPLRAAAGFEVRREKFDFTETNTSDVSYVFLRQNAARDIQSAFAELSVPLVPAANPRPLRHALELQLAGRIDRYEGFGNEFSPKAGLRWKPARSLTLRGSYGEGFKSPSLYALIRPANTSTTTLFSFFAPFDPLRGGEPVNYPIRITNGGNPDLRPEESESYNAGFIYEPTWAPGLSLSVDYYKVDFTNRVLVFVDLQDLLDYFPERITRGPSVGGMPGRVTHIDRRALNFASTVTDGYDIRLQYEWPTAAGRWQLAARGTRVLSFIETASPAALPTPREDPKWRANASLFWSKDAWEAGVTWRHISSSPNTIARFDPTIRPDTFAAANEFDLNISVELGRTSWSGGAARRWLRDTKLSLVVTNLADTEPPPTSGDGGFIHLDPRMRRFTLALRRQF